MNFTNKEDDWRCCSMHDPAGRRGIWYRTMTDGSLHIIAGREGDDAAVIVPPEFAKALRECLDWGAWMQEDYGPDFLDMNKK